MAEPTEALSERPSSELDDGLEWLPPEIRDAPRKPLFQRLTTEERVQRRLDAGGRDAGRRPRRFQPAATPPANRVKTAPKPALDRESAPAISRRLAEVEAALAKAAQAVDRSAINVQTMVRRNGAAGTEHD